MENKEAPNSCLAWAKPRPWLSSCRPIFSSKDAQVDFWWSAGGRREEGKWSVGFLGSDESRRGGWEEREREAAAMEMVILWGKKILHRSR